MPRPTKGPRLGSGPTHQRLMLGSLAAQLIQHERIRTTETKAKRLRPLADRLVTLGKDGSVHARRRALTLIEDREVIHKLFADVAPRFADRNGGYTRVLKLGPRQGDAAPMAIIEFVDGSVEAAPPAEAEQRRRRGLRRRKPPKTPAAEPARGASETSAQHETDEAGLEEEPGVMQGSPESDPAAGDAGTDEAAEDGDTGPSGGTDSPDEQEPAAGEGSSGPSA